MANSNKTCFANIFAGSVTGAGQSFADIYNSESSVSIFIFSTAVVSLALYGIPSGAILPLHLRQVAQGVFLFLSGLLIINLMLKVGCL